MKYDWVNKGMSERGVSEWVRNEWNTFIYSGTSKQMQWYSKNEWVTDWSLKKKNKGGGGRGKNAMNNKGPIPNLEIKQWIINTLQN